MTDEAVHREDATGMAHARRMRAAVEDVRRHVAAWIRLTEAYIASLPPDAAEGADDPGRSGRSYAEHELQAMKRDLGALLASANPGRPRCADEVVQLASEPTGIPADDAVWATPALPEILYWTSKAGGNLEAAADVACSHILAGPRTENGGHLPYLAREAVLGLSAYPALIAWAVANEGRIPAYGGLPDHAEVVGRMVAGRGPTQGHGGQRTGDDVTMQEG